MSEILTQILGLAILIVPIAAIPWNLTGSRKKQSKLGSLVSEQRWRLEIYSNSRVENPLVNAADIPFPIKQVRSARGDLAQRTTGPIWSLPQIELEVDVDDPFDAEAMDGMFGAEHRVWFVSGNEAVIDSIGLQRLRIRALPF